MKNEPAQSPLTDAVNSGPTVPITPAELQNAQRRELPPANRKLTQDDVIHRLFSPESSLPVTRSKHAIVVVTAGETERAVTHAQIETLIDRGVRQLKDLGVKEGDKIIFYCDNGPELTSTILACWALNAMAVLIDYRAEREDVVAISKELGAKLLLTSRKMYTDYRSDTLQFTDAGLNLFDVLQLADYRNNKGRISQFDINSLNLDRPAFTILTSGTTGKPKVSVHTLRSLVHNLIDLAEASELQGSQSKMTALTPLPISHIFGLSVFLVTQVLGMKTVLTELEPVGFIKAVHRHKPELIAALPQFYGALLAAPHGFVNLNNARLLLCGGASLTVSLSEKFEKTFGKRLNNGYGSTECKLVSFNKDGPVLSVGRPVGSIRVDIVNEQDEILSEGKTGEVRITGSMLMDGYLDNAEESRKVLHNGHYYTGDIGRLQNGYLFVVGRKGDVVIVGGVIVQAGDVEEALRNNPEVKDVAVTAVPNKRLGQIIKASVVLVDDKAGEKLKSTDKSERLQTQQALQRRFREYCREHLSRYQRPMKWDFLGPHDNLPKTLAGKTDKKTMS